MSIFANDEERAAWLFKLYDTSRNKDSFIKKILDDKHYGAFSASLFWEIMDRTADEIQDRASTELDDTHEYPDEEDKV